jgi:hypothetical protein
MLLIQLPGYGLQTASSVYALQEEGVDILDLNLDLTRQICGDGYRMSTDDESMDQVCRHFTAFKDTVKRLHNFDTFAEFVSPYTETIRGYSLFGVSLNVDWMMGPANHLVTFIRSIRPDAMIAAGGTHVTDTYPEVALALLDAGFNIVVMGDGSAQIRELMASGSFQRCFSSVFARNGARYVTSNRDVPLGMPRFHPNISRYPFPQILTVPLNIGCYYRQCSFCAERTYAGSSKYYRAPNAEVISVLREMRANNVHFVWLGGSGIRKEEFRRLLKELNACGDAIPLFGLESRAFHVDEELAEMLKASRCANIEFGLESPNDHICNVIYNKGTDIPQFKAGLRNLDKVGYRRVCVNMIISSLFHDRARLDEIAEFLNAHECIGSYRLYLLSICDGKKIEAIASDLIEAPMVRPYGPDYAFRPEGEDAWFKGALRHLMSRVEKPVGIFLDENTNFQLASLVTDDQMADFRRRIYRAELSIAEEDFRPNRMVWCQDRGGAPGEPAT